MEKIQKSKKKMISKKVNTKRKAAKKQGKTPIKKKEDVKVKTGITFDQVVSKGCGLDVHKKTVVASIAGDGIKPETKTFKTKLNIKNWVQIILKAEERVKQQIVT